MGTMSWEKDADREDREGSNDEGNPIVSDNKWFWKKKLDTLQIEQ